MSRNPKKIFLLLFTIGLVLKVCMVFYEGLYDMLYYHEWGKASLQYGLMQAYKGIYFPIQYSIFEFCEYVNQVFRISSDHYFIPYKIANLFFDLLIFGLILTWLKNKRLSYFYSFLYWLNPYFLVVFSLGYVDFQFSALLLMTIVLLQGDPTKKKYLLAGIPLSIAFLMKPQVQTVILIISIYGLIDFLLKKRIITFFLLVPSVLLFSLYNVYFIFQNKEHPFAFIGSYLDTSKVMPCLTANMPNLWYPLAYFLKEPDAAIWSVPDTFEILPHVQFKFLVIFFFLLLTCYFCYYVVKKNIANDLFLFLVGFIAILTPFAMTNAHDNHFFTGIIFLILFYCQIRNKYTRALIIILFSMQSINILGYYGLAKNNITIVEEFSRIYNYKLIVPFLISVISIPLLIMIIRRIFFRGIEKLPA